MLSDTIIEFKDVWKKYSTEEFFHKSLRDDLFSIFKQRDPKMLKKQEFWALKEIGLTIKRGESIGLYGPNGAGKTTIMKLIASVTYPSVGSVEVLGSVAPLIEIGAGFHHDLTGRENIYMNGTILGMTLRDIKSSMKDIIRFTELDKFIDMPVKKYSSGMFLRLGFSVAVHSSADILLIDEVLAVGDERFQEKCISAINDMRSHRTLIIVSHNKPLLNKLVERIVYINKGELNDV